MSDSRNLVRRAEEFAKRAHGELGQRRKYTGEPYEVHPEAVARLVASVTDDPEVIAAAWLHDVVEDTGVTLKEIEQEFGARVMELVADLTDVSRQPDGNRAVRKAIDLAHTAKAAPEAKTVKLADLIDNCRSIAAHDPGFAKVYLDEMGRMLDVLKDGDEILYKMARKELSRGLDAVAAYERRRGQGPEMLDLTKRSLYTRIKRLFSEGFTAIDIAEPLISADASISDEELRNFMERHGLAVVGLSEEGRVIGYARLSREMGRLERCSPVPSAQILTAMASLADVIGVLALHDHCFLSAFGGIEGVVSRSDIQKPPVRMWLFGMVTIIEMYITRLIETTYPDGAWHSMVSDGRLKKARELAAERERRGQRVSLVDCLQLSDKAGIVMRDPAMRRDFGVQSRREARQVIKDLESLRNNLAHSQDIVSADWPAIVKMASRMDKILTRL